MQQPQFDPGLTQQYTGRLRRTINPDGTFNVHRKGTSWRDVHPYLRLVTIPWAHFFGLVLAFYAALNVVFACVYFALGPDTLQGGIDGGPLTRFLNAVYFSSQTLTTVGYGVIGPHTHAANMVAAIEALLGLLGFAVATGVLLGRVSRPSARIGFSERALMTKYQDGYAFQFRVVNRRTNMLMELEATVMLMTADRNDGELRRDFKVLTLERSKVFFFPLTWTVVHPIDRESPLYEQTREDLEAREAEFLILIKAWDETFGQIVHQRFSYRWDELLWDAKYAPAFTVSDDGSLVLEVNQVGALRS